MLFNNAIRAAKELEMRGLNTQEVQSAIVAFRNEAQSNPLLLRCQLHGNAYYGVEVRQEGKGSLQVCAIYENAYDNVLIATASTPYFYLCKIHDGEQSGVSITNNGKGTVEYCEIYAHRSANISISSGADPLTSNCKISSSQQSGVHVYDDGRGTIVNCAITENTFRRAGYRA